MTPSTAACLLIFGIACAAQTQPAASSTPPVIKLEDAIARARQYGSQIQSANLAVLLAKQDTAQARANRLPTLNAFNQFIYTEGNGTPSGVFIANDGVHVYNEQAVVHQDLFALARRGEINRALAAEAVAQAKIEVAARGLTATVIQNYFAIVAAQRRVANATISIAEAERFLDITQKQEKGGEAAHADVIKAQIDLEQRRRDLKEAQLNVEKGKIGLGVLIFPQLSNDFSVVDDLAETAALPLLAETQASATTSNPDLKAAQFTIKQSESEIGIARYQYLPSFALDFFYGIDANQFAIRSRDAEATGRSTQPHFEVDSRKNLGYSAQATLNIPVWNWGITRSKIKQAELKRDQAQADLNLAQRTLASNVATAYAEAQSAQSQLESLRASVELARENLRLSVLRYQAGESTALEVVDAQNIAMQSRNAYDDGLARYRTALANLKLIAGTL